MLFRLVYDDVLAAASYLIGCQKTGEAIIVDPERDVDRYIDLAESQGMRIVATTETHIHADFLSGSRELAERTGAHVYLAATAGPDWSYTWLNKKTGGGTYDHTLLKHNDTFSVGNIEFRALHTPGHTPEHICFLVTDRGGGADEPMGILTGDFVFVGDLGRPDLLETAAGVQGVKEAGARQLHESARKFLDLPEHLQVWPAHGAGSACGKALGAVPQSTVGYEVRHNAALKLAPDQNAFVESILEGQPEPPMYFARMKRDNRDGPAILGRLPVPATIDAANLASLTDATIIDSRPWPAFRDGHIPGSLCAPFDNLFANVVGSYVDPDDDVCLIAPHTMVEPIVRACVRIGIDRITYHATPEELDKALAATTPATSREVDIAAAQQARDRGVMVLDVRSAAEHAAARVPGAINIAYTRLPSRLDELPTAETILVHCAGAVRSARAVAYLQRLGYDAVNVAGGFTAWTAAGAPTERGHAHAGA